MHDRKKTIPCSLSSFYRRDPIEKGQFYIKVALPACVCPFVAYSVLFHLNYPISRETDCQLGGDGVPNVSIVTAKGRGREVEIDIFSAS